MQPHGAKCWIALLLGALAWLALALITIFRSPQAPGSLAALQSHTQRLAEQALQTDDLRWARVAVGDGVISLAGSPPSKAAGDTAVNAIRASTRAQHGFPGIYHTITTTFAPPVAAAPSQITPPPSADARFSCEERFRKTLSLGALRFRTGGATIPRSARPMLLAVTAVAHDCANFRLVIGGHTDNIGPPAYNQALSEKRAEAVRAFLAANGAKPVQMTAIGYGATRPLSREDSAQARAANRRITIDVEAL